MLSDGVIMFAPIKVSPAYYTKTIYYVKRLDHVVFLEEVKTHILQFEADKASQWRNTPYGGFLQIPPT